MAHALGGAEDRRRPLSLTGAINLRDIGGYPAIGGAVRFGCIYRSDSFADLTDDDVGNIESLGLHTICDLRHETERLAKPNRLAVGHAIRVQEIGFLPYRAHEMVAAARAPEATPEAMRADIRQAYRYFVGREYGTYRQLFDIVLEEGALPLLVHCTSGKDRTGVAIALLLSALGVPDEIIVKDYLLSNVYRRDLSYLAGKDMRPEMLDVMMEVDPSYIAASFDEIEQQWGTRDAFLTKVMGLDASRLARLRQTLITPSGAANL